MIEEFRVAAREEDLADLRERLAATRWPADFGNAAWSYGVSLDYLKELVGYWIAHYDWRAHERAMNTQRHFRTTLDGIPIHFIHERAKTPRAMPLILTHGWPWTFWDLRKVIGPLCDPQAYGGDAADAFDVVVPSLPGFIFSSPVTTPGVNFVRTADLWVKLMQDVLGYRRFAAQGGDWGALVSAQLGHKYADCLIGIHLHFLHPLDFAAMPEPSDYAPEEAGWLARNRRYRASGSAYLTLQSTKPQTITYALNDSPVGLCAWLLEKRRDWSDCAGDVESRFTKDDLLTATTLYWLTQTYGASARYYYEAAHRPWKPSHRERPVVRAPTGVAVFPQEILLMPRRWAERYYNLRRWTIMPSGGHFAPMEEPDRLVEEIRAFFRPLRA